ncbi:MAG TPA: hypothetical protein VNG31_08195 [Candidatus Baltobacteraceae bacterium]|nr:hypothetical protein [Candidatus Baltobacteraceae bacterium]
MILARTNVGVFEEAIAALEHKTIKGLSIAGGISQHSEFLLAAYALHRGQKIDHKTIGRFHRWDDLVTASKSEQGGILAPYVRLVSDYGSDIPSIVDRLLDAQRPPSKGGIKFTTVHREKGDEEDYARLARDFKTFRRENGEIDVQEANLWYVALTRARITLDLGGSAAAILAELGEPTLVVPLMAVHDAAAHALVASAATVSDVTQRATEPAPAAAATATLVPAAGDAPPLPASAPAFPAPQRLTIPEPADEVTALLAASSARSESDTATSASARASASTVRPGATSERLVLPLGKRTAGLAGAMPQARRRIRRVLTPIALVVPERDRYRAGRAGARRTAAGWMAPAGADFDRCEAWVPRSQGGKARSNVVLPRARLEPTGEARWIVGEPWIESLGPIRRLRLRQTLSRRQQGACAACNAVAPLELHVDFAYAHAASMVGLRGLCVACHGCQHLERVTDDAAVIAQLARVNRDDAALSALRVELAREQLRTRDEQWYLLEDRLAEGGTDVTQGWEWANLIRTMVSAGQHLRRSPAQAFLRWFAGT